MPYPKETYEVEVDEAKEHIVVRTTNKKYFRKWTVPALRRLGVALDPSLLSHQFAAGVLLVSYRKPEALRAAEAERRKAILASMDKTRKSGGIDCTTH